MSEEISIARWIALGLGLVAGLCSSMSPIALSLHYSEGVAGTALFLSLFIGLVGVLASLVALMKRGRLVAVIGLIGSLVPGFVLWYMMTNQMGGFHPQLGP